MKKETKCKLFPHKMGCEYYRTQNNCDNCINQVSAIIKKDGYNSFVMKGLEFFIDAWSIDNVQISATIDLSDHIKSEKWETKSNDPDTDYKTATPEDVFSDMDDKELIPIVIKCLQEKLSQL